MEKHNGKSWGREIFVGVAVTVISTIILVRLGLDKPSEKPEEKTTPRFQVGLDASNSSPPVDSDATKLIGRWQANIVENGIQVRIIWHLQAEGKMNYQFMSNRGSPVRFGTWQYSDGVIYERDEYGREKGKDVIKWIDNNHIEVTILDDHGMMKLQYSRY